jgi:hypothetical protein
MKKKHTEGQNLPFSCNVAKKTETMCTRHKIKQRQVDFYHGLTYDRVSTSIVLPPSRNKLRDGIFAKTPSHFFT